MDEEEILALEASSPISSNSSKTMKLSASPQDKRFLPPILQSPVSFDDTTMFALVEESPIKINNILDHVSGKAVRLHLSVRIKIWILCHNTCERAR